MLNPEKDCEKILARRKAADHPLQTREISSPKNNSMKFPPLDGGLAAWMAVGGAFLVQFSATFIDKSFGVLVIHLNRVFSGGSASSLLLISSLFLSFHYFSGFFVSSVMNRGGFSPRQIMIFGGLVSCGFLIWSAFASSVVILYFSYGIFQGIAIGFCYLSCIICVNQYFEKRRAIANALMLCGNAIGGIISAYVLNYLMEEFSIFGTFLILGGFMLHYTMAGFLSRPIADNYPNLNFTQVVEISTDSVNDKKCIKTFKKYFGVDLNLLRNPVLGFHLLAMGLGSTSLEYTWVLLPPLITGKGHSTNDAVLSLTVLFIFRFIGNIFFGLILNYSRVMPYRPTIFIMVILFTGILDGLAPMINSFHLFITWSILNGTLASIYMTLRNVALLDLVGRQNIEDVFGFQSASVGVGSIIVQMSAAAAIDHWGGFEAGFYFTSATEASAAVAMAAAVAINKKNTRKVNPK